MNTKNKLQALTELGGTWLYREVTGDLWSLTLWSWSLCGLVDRFLLISLHLIHGFLLPDEPLPHHCLLEHTIQCGHTQAVFYRVRPKIRQKHVKWNQAKTLALKSGKSMPNHWNQAKVCQTTEIRQKYAKPLKSGKSMPNHWNQAKVCQTTEIRQKYAKPLKSGKSMPNHWNQAKVCQTTEIRQKYAKPLKSGKSMPNHWNLKNMSQKTGYR